MIEGLKAILPFLALFILQSLTAMKYKIIDITDQLPKNGNYGKRSLSQIVRFVIHHSATTTGDPWQYAKYHVENHGWPGIGYHFVIQKDGTIYQTNSLDTISYHVEGNNTASLGICLTGNYEVETPPIAQINSLVWLLKKLSSELGQKPIEGHRAFKSTKCPGDHIDTEAISQMVYGPNV